MLAVTVLATASSACTLKNSGERSDAPAVASRSEPGGGAAELGDVKGTKVALVPGGAHHCFQPCRLGRMPGASTSSAV
ncbi:hypothetical protein [Streptomyces sp. NBC_00842]|uniref:hypothetical protein n=1 Tax=Streptomyces sp. NBC_00842 TaxID=2975848 RepID=UPI00386B7EA3|nr:hypothetical protein OH821_39500 [Streptomyces sp. NBC_00842]